MNFHQVLGTIQIMNVYDRDQHTIIFTYLAICKISKLYLFKIKVVDNTKFLERYKSIQDSSKNKMASVSLLYYMLLDLLN